MPQFLKTPVQRYGGIDHGHFLVVPVHSSLTSLLSFTWALLPSPAWWATHTAGTPEFQNILHLIMIGLAVFALVITLGGMKVIGYTDVIQVAVFDHWWFGYYLPGFNNSR